MSASTRRLWEISGELTELEQAIEGEDLSPEDRAAVIDAWLESCDDLPAAIDRYAELVGMYEATAAYRKSEAERLLDLAHRDANRAATMRDRLRTFMASHSIPKLSTPRYQLRVQGNGGVAPLEINIPAEELPVEYTEQVITIRIRKDALRTAIEQGEDIAGVRLLPRGTRLVIQ